MKFNPIKTIFNTYIYGRERESFGREARNDNIIFYA